MSQKIAVVTGGGTGVGKAITKVAHKAGFSVIRTFCGHGVGRLFHGNPSIPHYKNNRAVGVMKPGHVFTIEPMINEGTYHDKIWPDGWTCVTEDGKRSAQFEHTMLITEDGVEVLTRRSVGSYIDRKAEPKDGDAAAAAAASADAAAASTADAAAASTTEA